MAPRGADRRRLRRWLTATAAGLTLVALGAWIHYGLTPEPRLVWNASESAPVGLWRIMPGAKTAVGDMVLANPPGPARRLAAERGYLPANVPLLKRLAAVSGDRVCVNGDTLAINGQAVAIQRAADGLGREMPRWIGCRALREGEALLLMDAADSFDGRYFGPVSTAAIIGKATPLWVR